VRDTGAAALERVVAELVERIDRRYFGKYRGLVVDNRDPATLGRLKLRVPSVLGGSVVTGWASPCVPYGGAADQGLLMLPDPGAGVWVEFEEGDLEFPIWVGTFWSGPGSGSELPRPNQPDGSEQNAVQDPVTRKILKTAKGHTLQFEDADGAESITLVEGKHRHVMLLDQDGITLTDGKNGHRVVLRQDGISITDGKNSGNSVVLDGSGVTVADANGNKIVMGSAGIKIGGSASEPMVLGQQFALQVQSFLTSLGTHTHVGNLGAPTSPPMAPITLSVPISTKHRVE
jgi:hypothetical protein